MNRFLLMLFLIAVNISSAQTEMTKWGAEDVSYEMKTPAERNFQVDNSNSGSLILTGSVKIYHTLVSDLDGDNCPFYPSCSEFFVRAVKKTNLVKGLLMFVDRFTRDTNFFKGRAHYPFHSSGKLYDPVVNYTLDFENIKYIPYNHIVK